MAEPAADLVAAFNNVATNMGNLDSTIKDNVDVLNRSVAQIGRRNTTQLIFLVVVICFLAWLEVTITQSRNDRERQFQETRTAQEEIKRQQNSIIDANNLDVVLRQTQIQTSIVVAYCVSQADSGKQTFKDCITDYKINLPAKSK